MRRERGGWRWGAECEVAEGQEREVISNWEGVECVESRYLRSNFCRLMTVLRRRSQGKLDRWGPECETVKRGENWRSTWGCVGQWDVAPEENMNHLIEMIWKRWRSSFIWVGLFRLDGDMEVEVERWGGDEERLGLPTEKRSSVHWSPRRGSGRHSIHSSVVRVCVMSVRREEWRCIVRSVWDSL